MLHVTLPSTMSCRTLRVKHTELIVCNIAVVWQHQLVCHVTVTTRAECATKHLRRSNKRLDKAVHCALVATNYWGDQIKKNEMGRACGTDVK